MDQTMPFTRSSPDSREGAITMHKNVLAVIFLFVPIFSQGASFDCAKATTNVERLICQDTPASRSISKLDSRMSDAYASALKSSAVPVALKKAQRDWLDNVRNKCSDVACLESAYTQRIEQLTNKKTGNNSDDSDVRQGKSADGKHAEIASLRMGHAGEKAKVVPMLVGNTCKLNIVTSQNKQIQVIELPNKNWCPNANFFATFDPNQDGYDDFVTVSSFMAGPYPQTSAWLYSPEEKKYVRDGGFPGGWPTGEHDSGCVKVEVRIGIGGGEYAYTEDVYCLSAHEWR